MSEAIKIPTERNWDWDEPCSYYHGDIDYARAQFSGRSIEEMIPRFIQLPLAATEDLYYMPKTPFQYYVMAFKKVFMSDECRQLLIEEGQAPDAASTFLHLLKSKFREYPEHIAPVMPELLPVAEFVAANQAIFEADLDIYGSFPELLNEIKTTFSEYQSRVR